MKLLKCNQCDSNLIPLSYQEEKSCPCGASKGRYVTLRTVEYSGPAEIWAVASRTFFSGDDWKSQVYKHEESPHIVKL